MSLAVRAARAWRRPACSPSSPLAGLVSGAARADRPGHRREGWLASTLVTIGSLFAGLLRFLTVDR
ncbi:hypothetical protein HBB16_21715 [Pseudonocardia sp. MCCB 268]|nr:hypothetical protein [Pseudonocardia cytotoxica]